jgi:hypothetical protein
VSTIGDTTVTPRPLSGSDQALVTGAGRFKGLSIRETAAAAASVVLYDNTAASGTILATVALAAGESADLWLEGDGLLFTTGIYVDVTGTLQGSVRVRV